MFLETPAGSTVSFSTKDTVSADFNYSISYGCKADTGVFLHSGGGQVNQWSWQFDNSTTLTQQNPVHVFSTYREQHVRLQVTNGTCTDSSEATFSLDNKLKANFTAPVSLCPQDVANFKDSSIGKVVAWEWNFGNGTTSTLQAPPAAGISRCYR
jgi:PKD repeat protein